MFVYDDNFLDPAEIEKIDCMFSQDMPNLVHQKETVPPNHHKWTTYISDNTFGDIDFLTVHPALDSEEYKVIENIIKQFTDKNNVHYDYISRARFNLTPVKDKGMLTFPHVDDETPHLIFLYYINDADGDTVLYDELYSDDIKHTNPKIMRRISPKAGSAFIANGSHFHSIDVPLKGNSRKVINANLRIF